MIDNQAMFIAAGGDNATTRSKLTRNTIFETRITTDACLRSCGRVLGIFGYKHLLILIEVL